MDREIHGYYFDGKKSWILYKEEDGKIVTEEDNDE